MLCNIIENVFKQVKGYIVQKFTLATKRPITIIIKFIKIKKRSLQITLKSFLNKNMSVKK